jgi:hypothetical protein
VHKKCCGKAWCAKAWCAKGAQKSSQKHTWMLLFSYKIQSSSFRSISIMPV